MAVPQTTTTSAAAGMPTPTSDQDNSNGGNNNANAETYYTEKAVTLSTSYPSPVPSRHEDAIAPGSGTGRGRNNDNDATAAPLAAVVPSRLRALNARIEGLAGFEARGITRVLPEERRPASLSDDLQVAIMWFSANISLNNLAAGMLGPLLLELGFLDCALLAVFGALVGSLTTAYMAIWGPQSGNRTMVRSANTPGGKHSRKRTELLTESRSCFASSWATGRPRSPASSTSSSWSGTPPLTASSAGRSSQP